MLNIITLTPILAKKSIPENKKWFMAAASVGFVMAMSIGILGANDFLLPSNVICSIGFSFALSAFVDFVLFSYRSFEIPSVLPLKLKATFSTESQQWIDRFENYLHRKESLLSKAEYLRQMSDLEKEAAHLHAQITACEQSNSVNRVKEIRNQLSAWKMRVEQLEAQYSQGILSEKALSEVIFLAEGFPLLPDHLALIKAIYPILEKPIYNGDPLVSILRKVHQATPEMVLRRPNVCDLIPN